MHWCDEVSQRFLTHERATNDSLSATTTGTARSTEAARTAHALHACRAAIVEPAKGEVVHEEHARLVVCERLDLDATQATEVLGEADLLELAVFEAWARRELDLSVVGGDFIAELRVPGPASDVEHTRFWAIVIAAEPSAFGIEPEGGHTVVRAIGDLARLSAGSVHGQAILVPGSVVGSIAGC
jgi:hypothetical protein